MIFCPFKQVGLLDYAALLHKLDVILVYFLLLTDISGRYYSMNEANGWIGYRKRGCFEGRKGMQRTK